MFDVIKTNEKTGRFTRVKVAQTINCESVEDLDFIYKAISYYNESLPATETRWLSQDTNGDITLIK